MSYVIYEKSSTYIMGKVNKWDGTVRPDHRKSYKTLGAAKAALTRMSKRHRADMLDSVNDPVFRYGIAATAYFHQNIEKQVKKRNLITNEEFMEPANRPMHCSPSSESFWSM